MRGVYPLELGAKKRLTAVKILVSRLGIEPRTLSVLNSRDSHYTIETILYTPNTSTLALLWILVQRNKKNSHHMQLLNVTHKEG